MATTLGTVATREDRDYAWRHAFCYADQLCPTDDAVRYANHYAQVIADEEEMNHWPGHGEVFAAWRKGNPDVVVYG